MVMTPFLRVLRGSWFFSWAPLVAFASVLATPLGAQDGRANASRPAGSRVVVKVPYAGFQVEEAPEVLSHHFPIPSGFGLLVTEVGEDSPAADVGIQLHDLLLRSGDQRLVNPGQLNALIRTRNPGETLSLTVFRAGKEWEVGLTLWEAEEPLRRTEDGARSRKRQPAPTPSPKAHRPAGRDSDLSQSAAFFRELLQKTETMGDDALRKFRDIEPFQFLPPRGQPSGEVAPEAAQRGKRVEGPSARDAGRSSEPAASGSGEAPPRKGRGN
jgi:hypothetical protein